MSPDSRWLVSGSADGTARLWDLKAETSATSSIILKGHKGAISCLSISPDGRLLATGGFDVATRLWILDEQGLLAVARRAAGRNLSREEWHRYLRGEDYRPTFPDLPVPPDRPERSSIKAAASADDDVAP